MSTTESIKISQEQFNDLENGIEIYLENGRSGIEIQLDKEIKEEQKGFIRGILEEINEKRFDYCIICESEEEREQKSSELSLDDLIYTASEVYSEWIDQDKTEDDFLFGQYYSLKELNLLK